MGSAGSRGVCRFSHTPPAVEVLDLASQLSRLFRLPPSSRIGVGTPGHPVWESERHLLVALDGFDADLGGDAVRLDTGAGLLEPVVFPPAAGYRPLLVEPLLQPNRA